MSTIRTLLDREPDREIEEVIKVDQSDLAKMGRELEEYVATGAIRKSLGELYKGYYEGARNHRTEKVGIWVSGFFGSGKSSFAKLFGISVGNAEVELSRGKAPAGKALRDHIQDPTIGSVLAQINEQIPTHLVILDVSTEQQVKSAGQMLTEILFRKLQTSFGYAEDLDLAELEFSLRVEGQFDAFAACFERIHGKPWDQQKALPALAINKASRVLQEIDPQTYPTANSWSSSQRGRHDVNPEKLAQRALDLLRMHKPGQNLLFVVDEVGQYVARDVGKMLDLQGIVQTLGRVGNGQLWLMVTAQEKLTEVVGALGDSRIELARLMDRFPPPERQVHLEQSDITEVTSRRVLQKNASGQAALRALFQANRGRLQAHTKATADLRLPDLDEDSFVRMYPLLPYQVDLVISVVSGLRTQGGASQHVGGANRTIIKLTQQLLINSSTRLADQPVGTLVGMDQVYDLIQGNIASDIRERVQRIEKSHADNLWMSRVAKCVCLLSFAPPYHRTTENIAAMLHPAVDSDSILEPVRAALEELERRHFVRKDEKGWKIPSPAEEDWEKTKQGIQARPGDLQKLYRDALTEIFQPLPKFDAKGRDFKASILVDGHALAQGDLEMRYFLVDEQEWSTRIEELRAESRSEKSSARWALRIDAKARHLAEALFRSIEVIARKGRTPGMTLGGDAYLLRNEEKSRDRLRADLREALSLAVVQGQVWFRGNDRSVAAGSCKSAREAVERVLGQVALEVFDRFQDAATLVRDKEIEQVITSPSLDHLPDVVTDLRLLTTQQGKTAFQTETGLLAEIASFVVEQNGYGRAPTGKQIVEAFERAPYGWTFDTVRLLVLCLFRADRLEATSQSGLLDSIQDVSAKNLFRRNNDFRSATFRPRRDGLDIEQKAEACDAIESIWGQTPTGTEEGSLAQDIRQHIGASQGAWSDAREQLLNLRLPGEELFYRALQVGQQIASQNATRAIQLFLSEQAILKQAIQRASFLKRTLTDDALESLTKARMVLERCKPELQAEPDPSAAAGVLESLDKLTDILQRETFFEHLGEIHQLAAHIQETYATLRAQQAGAKEQAYREALQRLHAVPQWGELDGDRQEQFDAPLREGVTTPNTLRLSEIRSLGEACGTRFEVALRRVYEAVEGDRLVTFEPRQCVAGRIESQEELEAFLGRLRLECEKLLATGRKILVR